MHQKSILKWHTFSDHLKNMLHDMMKSNDLTDVTLICDDKKQFKAHKIVLKACSSVFKSIIENLPPNNSAIYLRGVNHQEIEAVLDFMYLGVATTSQERLDEFLKVSISLGVKEIITNGSFDVRNTQENDDAQDKNQVSRVKTESKRNTKNATDYSASYNLEPNKRANSSDASKFSCYQCDYKDTKQENVTSHLLYAHRAVQFPCNLCQEKFSTQGRLIRHIQSVHDGVKFVCNQCSFQTYKSSILKTHVEKVHTTERKSMYFG